MDDLAAIVGHGSRPSFATNGTQARKRKQDGLLVSTCSYSTGAGEQFTPRKVNRLMANLIYTGEQALLVAVATI